MLIWLSVMLTEFVILFWNKGNSMKKILLLGGSSQQIIAIETAKRLGFYTVLCDFLVDNPGQYVADKFYLISTTDKEKVLAIAYKENVRGVLAYASDPAAPTAAYVAEQLHLPTNPYDAVKTLCNKGLFRVFLQKNGFNTPYARAYKEIEEISQQDMKCFQLPVIVKPVDSSGSKGVTVLHSWDRLGDAFSCALLFSRSHQVIMEKFIEKKHPYLIGGDIFIVEGKVVLWGLLNCHRDAEVNFLVPVGKSYPLDLDNDDVKAVKETLQDLVNKLGLRSGAVNVELIVDIYGKVWPIDIGARAGGNMIPDLLSMIFNVDVVEMILLAAMGSPIDNVVSTGKLFYATHNIHADKNGILEEITFSKILQHNIVRVCIYKKPGSLVEYFDNASKALGIVFLRFDSGEEMHEVLNHINTYIKVKVKEME